ncbi:MAG TPA: response regulator transcription factor [Actinophytocola sp.]|uniref:response regulator transcription factor n=1 Tax=Actinophytocola sp. TaxID=1872138 RepID=UPI002DBAB6D6|nr:response regulator transcription factor [Actinophytocola sp.]HEU5473431.1 response regulator transcription factor [Actinophytocola sp.]
MTARVPVVRIVLADDHDVVREGLRALFTPVTGIEVVAEAETVRDTVAQTVRHRPDVLLLGLQLPQHRVSSVIKEVLAQNPGVAVLVFSTRDDDATVAVAIRAGARGYVGKATAKAEIIRAVRGVAAGWAVLSPRVATVLATIMSNTPDSDARAFPGLTAREYQILDLIATGMSNVAIARRLTLSAKTINNHVSRIFAKLGVADRANAVLRARDAGLGHLP